MDAAARAADETARAADEEAERARVRLATLRSAPVASAGNEVAITAPCTGTVARLHARAPGAVVAEGEPLADLACAGKELRAEIAVADRGLGLVAAGQRVKLYYDAFPYQRHGVRYATVRWIGPASGARPDAPAFRVLADLDAPDVVLRGVRRPFLPGMSGSAEIVVAEQTALAYGLEPLRALRENLARPP